MGPIPAQSIREARAKLVLDGKSVEDWSRENGFAAKLVYEILSGRRRAIRGKSLQIAKKLGLRPDTANPAPSDPAAPQGLPVALTPAGRTIAGGPPNPDRNRRPISQLGEPVS
ncbi:hypothetical protein [Sphingosinicella sp. CPCC 101087]|uniref:hypothetical protein n=1 Tax=Sphingosinicella sp. CPCC 101087 TaxID=2497754 RepID=UPI0013EBE253|nr:hypothetical protein [Sphingosinicella sp. CPCC 101087]